MTVESYYRIGVDVGGTNTDAVLLDVAKSHDPVTRGVVASFKHPTTPDVTDGIEAAVKTVLQEANLDAASSAILSLTIGTTHFINAVVSRDTNRLAPVAVIRLSAPYATSTLPFADFPEDLASIMNGHAAVIKGGLQVDGSVISKIDDAEVVEQARIIKEKGLKDIALVGTFSPLDAEGKNEYYVRSLLQRELGEGYNIVCSRDVAQIGFLPRENASILNASINRFARRTIRGFEKSMDRLGLVCPLFLTQNDGTLTSAAEAAKLPIKTFSSGATNSMRGAAYLAGFGLKKAGEGKSMIVVDIGGTTTDVGILLPSGFPRQSAAFIEVGGVRTNFSMPDLQSIGLGGGSRVRVEANGKVTVGPDSVGHFLIRDAKVFGGDVLTSTDVCVAGGGEDVKEIGDASRVADVSKDIIAKAKIAIKKLLEDFVDKMKTSPEPATLLLVGGGSIVAPPVLEGVGEIVTPPFHSCANAVGAAIASVNGEVDTIIIMEGKSLPVVLEDLKKEALNRVVENGGLLKTARIVNVDVLPMQYVTNQATRIIVRAVGELSNIPGATKRSQTSAVELAEDEEEVKASATLSNVHVEKERIDFQTYTPKIVGKEWYLSETDLLFFMDGCYILGVGGGGSPYDAYLSTRATLRKGGRIRMVDADDVNPEGFLLRGAGMGSPSVGDERLSSSIEMINAASQLAKFFTVDKFEVSISDEIGGGNGFASLILGSSDFFDIPALDCDFMGRAYPNLYQSLSCVYDRPNSITPIALADSLGNTVIMAQASDGTAVENILRTVCTLMGSGAAMGLPPMPVHEAINYGVLNSMSQAWRMGRAVNICRQKNKMREIASSILEVQNGKLLFVGKIVGVDREVRAGFTWGTLTVASLLDEELEDDPSAPSISTPAETWSKDDKLIVPFQNENICAYIEAADGTRKTICTVPDLICVLDSQSGGNLGTQDFLYGQRVTVLALACSPLWTTKKGLAVGGPGHFGLPDPFVPIAEYKTPKSVIKEFST